MPRDQSQHRLQRPAVIGDDLAALFPHFEPQIRIIEQVDDRVRHLMLILDLAAGARGA